MSKRVPQEVLTVLGSMETKDHVAFLPEGVLDRKLYEAVNKVLVALGGKWDRKAKGHMFDGDPRDQIDEVLATGEVTSIRSVFQFFETPEAVARELIERAQVKDGMRVLEPSAGKGAIVRELVRQRVFVIALELDPKHRRSLDAIAETLVDLDEGDRTSLAVATPVDFLKPPDAVTAYMKAAAPDGFDAVVMNPPFSHQQDIDHVLHAATCLRPGGRLASVMSAGVRYRQNRKTVEFRRFVEAQPGYRITDLPDGSFKASGTNVCTVLVSFQRPE